MAVNTRTLSLTRPSAPEKGYASSVWFRACQRCGGDAYVDLIDEPAWRCLQCARHVPEQATAQPVPATVQVQAA